MRVVGEGIRHARAAGVGPGQRFDDGMSEIMDYRGEPRPARTVLRVETHGAYGF